MKVFFLIVFLLMGRLLLSQNNNKKEMTLGTYDYNSMECQPLMVWNGTSNLIYPCRNKDENKKNDILEFKNELSRLSEIITLDFIDKLRNCCFKIGCMDSSEGHFIRVEDDGNANYFYLDNKDGADKLCGHEEIDEIRVLFEKISKSYR